MLMTFPAVAMPKSKGDPFMANMAGSRASVTITRWAPRKAFNTRCSTKL